MKKLILILSICVFSICFYQQTEAKRPPKTNLITINPLKFLLFYNLTYYHAVNDFAALGFGIQFPSISSLKGFGINLEGRLYPSKKALYGFYFAPNISANFLGTDVDDDASANSFSIGGLAGWQWFIGDDFAIGIGIGVGL